MATYVPAKVSTQFIFFASLVSQANTKLMQVNPTIAAGDFKVSIDGAALANLGTLPAVTPAGSTMVKFTLSTSEMAGANATVVCIDAAGSEWCDLVINIPTAARQIDDLTFPTTSGRSLDVTATGAAGVDWANVENPTTTLALTGTTVATTQKVDVETIKTNAVVNGGTITFPTTATLASTTNITAGTVTTATNVTTLNGIAANVITAAATAADFSTEVNAAVIALLPTALVGGRMDASVGAMAASVLTAAATAADFSTEVNSAPLAILGTPAGASMSADIAAVKVDTAAILVDTGTTLDAALAVVDANVDAILVDTAEIGAAGAGLSAVPWNAAWDAEVQSEVDDALGATVADSVPADGTRPSVKQALLMITRFLMERSVASTTVTVAKEDGTTASMTFTLDDATTPTAITRTT